MNTERKVVGRKGANRAVSWGRWGPATELFRSHNAGYVRLARQFVGLTDAEDVTQNAWTSAGPKLGRLSDMSDRGSYMRKTVVNAAYHALRHRASDRRQGYSAYETDVMVLIDEGFAVPVYMDDTAHFDSSRIGDARMALQRVVEGIKALPTHQRKIIKLRIEGHTEEQVAKLLGITRGTVASSTNRAREKLKQRLEEYIVQ